MSYKHNDQFDPSKLRTAEKIILGGKRPTLRALAMEMRKSTPLPEVIRDYIAEYLEQASHSNGTRDAKRVFSRSSGDITPTSDEVLFDNLNKPVVDAYLEYQERRAEVKVYRQIAKSGVEKLSANPVKVILDAIRKACPNGDMIDQLISNAAFGCCKPPNLPYLGLRGLEDMSGPRDVMVVQKFPESNAVLLSVYRQHIEFRFGDEFLCNLPGLRRTDRRMLTDTNFLLSSIASSRATPGDNCEV